MLPNSLYQVLRWLSLNKYETAVFLVPGLVEVVDLVQMLQWNSPVNTNFDIVDEGAISTIARSIFWLE